MKKIGIYIVLFIAVVGLSSCEDWLNVSPKADVKAEDLFNNEDGFRDVLTGVYSLLTTNDSYGKELSYGYVDVLAQYYDKITGVNHEYIKTSAYQYEEPKDKSKIAKIWSNHYKAIVNLNSILEFIDKNKSVFSSEEVYKIYKGEALGLRAMLHFDLLRMFGSSPVVGMDKKAIPYMKSYTNISQEQLTVDQVLIEVVNDLNIARDLVRNIDSYGPNYMELDYSNNELLDSRKNHLNYYAMTALLARVNIYAGNKSKALEAAQEIIGLPGGDAIDLIEFASSATDRLFKGEVLFGLDKSDMKTVIDPYFGDAALQMGYGNSTQMLTISSIYKDALFQSQDPADDDFRLKLWFQDTDNIKYEMLNKYTGIYSIPMFRISELYYIAAECSLLEEDGLLYLNKIRAHRGLAPLQADVDLQEEISKEYKKEFIGEGQMFYYYKRLNMDKIGVFKSVLDVDSKIYELPIPVGELDYGKIEQ